MSTQRAKPKRAEKKEAPGASRAISGASLQTTVNIQDLIKKIESEVNRGTVKYYTPYTLAQAYNIKISDAKRALKEASSLGILKLYEAGRRSPIYIPLPKQRQTKEREK